MPPTEHPDTQAEREAAWAGEQRGNDNPIPTPREVDAAVKRLRRKKEQQEPTAPGGARTGGIKEIADGRHRKSDPQEEY